MIVSLTDYPRSRVPIIMASDRTGGGQPASHPAGDRGQGGEAETEDVRGRRRPDHPQLPVSSRPLQSLASDDPRGSGSSDSKQENHNADFKIGLPSEESKRLVL